MRCRVSGFWVEAKRATGDDGAGPVKWSNNSVEATSDSSAPATHAAQSSPQTGPKAFDGMPVDQLIEEFDMSIQKDEEILLLKTQLADAQAEARVFLMVLIAQNLGVGKMAICRCQGRAKCEDCEDARGVQGQLSWAVKSIWQGGKNNPFCRAGDFRHNKWRGCWESRKEKVSKLSIEYDEELEVRQSFGDVVKCALARGKAEAVEELHERRLLTVPAAQVPGYNQKAYEELVAAMEADEKLLVAVLISHR
ncbi:hypothetical protein Tco_0438683 [Tanacetum coccineum]|uniref:Uncharacterized protein n=1 Tax=Tanacetum coccineum TaxID=301880 RepID=A0ABQ5J5J7_9ASTR